jgi:hypothetical protein
LFAASLRNPRVRRDRQQHVQFLQGLQVTALRGTTVLLMGEQMRRWIAAAAVLVAIGCESGTTGTNTTAGSGSGKAHCDELQTLDDKCCSQGFKDACGSVSKAFTDAAATRAWTS